ncbi:arsenic resistance protein [Lipingzhangella sp. LS1_29]|uniref:Arsenic resistance protein n=1 Tax=Lipingzhangella rawalii TaxID=2055835 RepID=A0ABU2H1C1_9ACTN|nr:bile acid:sodium symporter [Lipingzhangella rawalii]MDS1269093.1 arsenic resistance protein [Lipingzhangella rawalii]
MSLVERFQSLLVAAAAAVGLAAGLVWPTAQGAQHVVLPILLVMLTAVFVQLEAGHIREVRQARSLVAASLLLNFALTPLLAWSLGVGMLADHPDLRIGLLLLLVTPCTDWYLVFTALARGHTAIAAALLPLNLGLQLVLLPLYVLLLGGEAAMVDGATLLRSVLLVLVLPLAVALVLRWLACRWGGDAWRAQVLSPAAGRVVIPLLCLAVLAMFAGQAHVVAVHATEILLLLVPLAVFFVAAPLAASATAASLRLPADHRATLTMTVTARNSPVALAIAVSAFPDRPLIAVALVVGPLVELPVLTFLSQLVRAPTRASTSPPHGPPDSR